MRVVELYEAVDLIRNGVSIKQSEYATGIPITRIETIADWNINPQRCGYANVTVDDFPNHVLHNGDILISHINSTKHLGKCAMYKGVPKILIHGMNLLGMRVNTDVAYPDYIYRVLCSQEFRRQLPKITKDSVNQSSFTVTNFKGLKIPLPPLKEQKRIAAILDKADAIRRKRQQAIDLTDQLLRSVFLDMFGDPVTNPKGWPVQEIQSVCYEIVDCVNKTAKSVDFVTSYKMIRTTNIRNFKIDTQNVRFVEKEIYEKWVRRLTPEVGDIFFTREAPAGEAAIVKTEEKIFLGQRSMHFRPDYKLSTSEFLLHELMGAGIKRQIIKMSAGSTVTHLSVPECKKFEIRVPPIELQKKFSEIEQYIEVKREKYCDSIVLSENLFSSLTQQAFSGELSNQTKAA
ncbi:MAG: restriction endonuclease subunit S [Gammaproteobacteria bacterium]